MEILKVTLTAVLSAASLFLITRIMGHKQLSQLDFFDYISSITIGSIAAELATELEKPYKPLIALAVYGTISVALSFVTSKLPAARKYVNGSPTILMNDGKIFRRNLKRLRLDLSEFTVLCREQGYFDLNDIQTAVFEHNGKLSILPKSHSRPVNPKDMGLETEPAHIAAEVIMDGKILKDNLKKLGLDVKWLEKKLKEQSFKNAGEVFLGVCDKDKKLSLFKGE